MAILPSIYENPILKNIFNPGTLPGTVFYAFITIVAAWIVGRIIRLAVNRYLDRAEAAGMDSTPARFLGELGQIVIYIVAFLCYAHLIPALQSLGTAWLASLGVVSVVVGLAAQSTLSNLIAGVSLVIYRPFRIGERIQVAALAGPEIGIVEGIDLGYTTLRTTDGRRLVLPNGVISNQVTVNFSRNLPHVQCDMAITVAQSGDIDRARDIILDIAKKNSKIAAIKGCFVTGIGGSGSVLTLSVMCVDPGDTAGIKSYVFENAKKAFDSAEIKIS